MSFSYNGTGGELFKAMIVGAILTGITFGIYGPWYMVKMFKYFASQTRANTPQGQVRFEYRGEGGPLFKVLLVGGLLTAITFGIYTPWFMCKLAHHLTENSAAIGPSGAQYRLRFGGEGGDLFGTYLVGAILTSITFGIYTPWFICKLRNWFASRMQIDENGQVIGALDFVGEGGELFGKWLGGLLLTMITLGIYRAWFDVNLKRFFSEKSRYNYKGGNYQGDFKGTGGDLFVVYLLGALLSGITLGIYTFWFMTNLMRFNTENFSIKRIS